MFADALLPLKYEMFIIVRSSALILSIYSEKSYTELMSFFRLINLISSFNLTIPCIGSYLRSSADCEAALSIEASFSSSSTLSISVGLPGTTGFTEATGFYCTRGLSATLWPFGGLNSRSSLKLGTVSPSSPGVHLKKSIVGNLMEPSGSALA